MEPDPDQWKIPRVYAADKMDEQSEKMSVTPIVTACRENAFDSVRVPFIFRP
jgi:hypothetical protein